MIVDCNPEFGCELALALPYAYWLHEQGELEKVVTIITYEEFSDLVTRTGANEITTMELIDAIAQINTFIYEAMIYYEES